MSAESEYFDRIAPSFGLVAAIAVTDSATAVLMTADANVGTELQAGRALRMYADGADVYYAWSKTADGIDDTATGTTAGKCQCLAKGTYIEERPPRTGTGSARSVCGYLLLKTKSGTSATLRVSVSSRVSSA
jgi:hypothetical protein